MLTDLTNNNVNDEHEEPYALIGHVRFCEGLVSEKIQVYSTSKGFDKNFAKLP